MADKNLQAVVSRLESVATRLEALSAGGGQAAGAASTDEVSPYVAAYDDFLNGPVAEFVKLSNAIGGDVKAQCDVVKQVFDTQRDYLNIASKSKQPDQTTLMQLVQPCGTHINTVGELREKLRGKDVFNHVSVISESIPALGWVTVSPAPGPFVKEYAEAGRFYLNRITKIIKDKDPQHVAWGKAWTSILTELQSYIKTYHTTGVAWNPKGGDAKSVKSSGSAAAPPPPPSAGPPPPPPPPPAAVAGDASAGSGASALFASINKGAGVTEGLRKVSDDMKTHKNPALRQGPAPFKPATSPKPTPKPIAKPVAASVKPPVLELQQGKKWVVEYQKDNKTIVLDQTEMRQTVYLYKCEGTVVQVKGKVNSIIVDSCKKTAVVFDDVVSAVEFVNCQSVQGQATGSVPTVSIDKTDGCQVYLSKEALDANIVAAKSSEMNILVPQPDGEFKEFALPEQFKTIYNKSKGIMETSATDI